MSAFEKELEEDAINLEVATLEGKLLNTRTELSRAKTKQKYLQEELERSEAAHTILDADINIVPKWAAPKKRKTKHKGTAILFLSDLHVDETIDEKELPLNSENKYDRKIAELRLHKAFTSFIEQSTYYHSNTEYDGALVVLGGDLVSGTIHDELRETNEGTMYETVVHWAPQIAAGLNLVADQFKKVQVVSVVGNHGRSTPRSRYRKRAVDNADYLLSKMVENLLHTDKRFTFAIPTSMDCYVDLYGYRVCITHGDQARGGGSGPAGILPTILKTLLKKKSENDFDLAMVGHYHQFIYSTMGCRVLVNGSLKGQDAFGLGNGYPAAPPSQSMVIFTPERGPTWVSELFVGDRKKEGW